MTVTQLSVFIENRQGRLGEVLRVLKESKVNILSISLADTTDYGLLRLIVNDPARGRDILIDAGFSSMLTEVLILKVPHVTGGLQEVLELIAAQDINIEYMYGLSVGGADAAIVMKTNQLSAACDLFHKERIETVTRDELSKLEENGK